MMFPVKSRNGNKLTARDRSRRGEPGSLRSAASKLDEMKSGMNVMLAVLLLLTGSWQAGGQSAASPPGSTPATFPGHTGTSASSEPTADPGNEAPQWTHNLASGNETWTESAAGTPQSPQTVPSGARTNAIFTTSFLTPRSTTATTNTPTHAPSSSAAAEALSSTQPGPLNTSAPAGTDPLASASLATFSSQTSQEGADGSSTAPTSTSTAPASQPQFESSSWQTRGQVQTSAPGRAPVEPTHHQGPSELNVGDEELKRSHYHSRSRLDPLLAGLLSVFIVSTAIVFVVLFLKFRQRTNHPEFHRLQDLPMDDLMEDTPLSRYSY